jgi:hypothetical protein
MGMLGRIKGEVNAGHRCYTLRPFAEKGGVPSPLDRADDTRFGINCIIGSGTFGVPLKPAAGASD